MTICRLGLAVASIALVSVAMGMPLYRRADLRYCFMIWGFANDCGNLGSVMPYIFDSSGGFCSSECASPYNLTICESTTRAIVGAGVLAGAGGTIQFLTILIGYLIYLNNGSGAGMFRLMLLSGVPTTLLYVGSAVFFDQIRKRSECVAFPKDEQVRHLSFGPAFGLICACCGISGISVILHIILRRQGRTPK